MGTTTTNANPYIQGANGIGGAAKDLLVNTFGGEVGIGNIKTTAAQLHVVSHSSSDQAGLFLGNGVYVNHPIGSSIFIGTQSDSDGKIVLMISLVCIPMDGNELDILTNGDAILGGNFRFLTVQVLISLLQKVILQLHLY